jgi:hypothetical protein
VFSDAFFLDSLSIMYMCRELGGDQGCQMVSFQNKIPIWVNFGGP